MQPLTTAVSKGVNLNMGMLNLVVSVHAAVGEDKSSAMKIVCHSGHLPTPIRMRSFCPSCRNEDGSSFERAREVDGGLVIIPQDVIDKEQEANQAFSKSIALTVHPINEVSSVLLPSGKSYYLSMVSPTAGALHTYTLLARLIETRRDLAFMTKMTLRTATTLFQLTAAGNGTLVLRQMADASLVREHPPIAFTELEERTLELAGLLADQQTTSFVVAEHGTGKAKIIDEYAQAQTPVAAPVVPGQVAASADIATVTDFTAHLAAMVAAGKKAAPKKRAARKPAAIKVSA